MKKPPRSTDLEGSRSGRDSNPQVLSDARFRGECNSRSATAPTERARTPAQGRGIRARTTSGARIGHVSAGRVETAINRGAWMGSADPGPDQDVRSRGKINRGARIRTGDLCDPNAALYRTEPHPGLLGYLRSGRGGIELRSLRDPRSSPLRSESSPRCSPLRGLRGFEREAETTTSVQCTCSAYCNGRGGIRTHAGVSPHDFQSCALSHSATRPKTAVADRTTTDLGVGITARRAVLSRIGASRRSAITTLPLESNPRAGLASRVRVGSNVSGMNPIRSTCAGPVLRYGGSGIRTHAVQAPTP